MIYKWKNTSFGIAAQLAGDRIEAIRERLGRVCPADVVDDARPKNAVLHRCFEWNDKVAAERWRVTEARSLLENIVCVPIEAPDAEPVRAFIAIGEPNKPNDFMPIAAVMTNDDLRRRALRAALDDLNRLKYRYRELTELQRVWAAVEEVPLAAVS